MCCNIDSKNMVPYQLLKCKKQTQPDMFFGHFSYEFNKKKKNPKVAMNQHLKFSDVNIQEVLEFANFE